MIHVMAAVGLSRATVPAPIMGNHAKAFAEKEKHLRIPIVRGERPAVAKDDGLSAAPVFIIDVDVNSVFFSDSDVWHWRVLSCYSALAKSLLAGEPLSCPDALLRRGTTPDALFRRSKLRSDWLWRRRGVPRTRCAPRAGARPALCCLR